MNRFHFDHIEPLLLFLIELASPYFNNYILGIITFVDLIILHLTGGLSNK